MWNDSYETLFLERVNKLKILAEMHSYECKKHEKYNFINKTISLIITYIIALLTPLAYMYPNYKGFFDPTLTILTVCLSFIGSISFFIGWDTKLNLHGHSAKQCKILADRMTRQMQLQISERNTLNNMIDDYETTISNINENTHAISYNIFISILVKYKKNSDYLDDIIVSREPF